MPTGGKDPGEPLRVVCIFEPGWIRVRRGSQHTVQRVESAVREVRECSGLVYGASVGMF